jgi:hypothetical protein
VSDIDTGVVDGLKALDLERPIREAAFIGTFSDVADGPMLSKIDFSGRSEQH